MNKSRFMCLLLVEVLISSCLHAQYNPLGTENSSLAMDRQTGFIIMTGGALGSFFISKYLLNDQKLDYYEVHFGYYNGNSGTSGGPMMEGDTGGSSQYESKNYSVFMENFGVEREFSRWFSLRVEGNLQQMTAKDYFTVGAGLKVYYKWTFLRNYRLHPFIEYGAGIFCALRKFPESGSNLTFNLNYAIGVEYILPNKNKIMLDFNFKHHSNNNLYDSNPGFDSNGVSISYFWAWNHK